VIETPQPQATVHSAFLENRFGTQEEFRAAMGSFELVTRGKRRPDSESRIAIQLNTQAGIAGVELHDGYDSTGRHWRLRHGVDLRTNKAVREQWKLVGGDVEPVRVRAQVRIAAKTAVRICHSRKLRRTPTGLGRCPGRSRVLHRDVIKVPGAARV